jgi:hypothetical protein
LLAYAADKIDANGASKSVQCRKEKREHSQTHQSPELATIIKLDPDHRPDRQFNSQPRCRASQDFTGDSSETSGRLLRGWLFALNVNGFIHSFSPYFRA